MNKWYRDELEALPPPEVRLYDPLNYRSHERIPTPLSSIGLVDEDALIAAVHSTIDPSHKWPFKLSKHHFYWEEEAYPHEPHAYGNRGAFRNLTVHKGIFIRSFENWLHIVTEKPPMPDPDVRQYRLEAWDVAKDLFKMANQTVAWYDRAFSRQLTVALYPDMVDDPEDRVSTEYIERTFERSFRGFDFQMSRNEKIPPELRIIHDAEPTSIIQQLGSVITARAVNFVNTIQPPQPRLA